MHRDANGRKYFYTNTADQANGQYHRWERQLELRGAIIPENALILYQTDIGRIGTGMQQGTRGYWMEQGLDSSTEVMDLNTRYPAGGREHSTETVISKFSPQLRSNIKIHREYLTS